MSDRAIQEREEIENRVGEMLRSQNPELSFSSWDLFEGPENEHFKDSIIAFRFLFANGGECLDYLWNSLWGWVEPETTAEIDGLNEDERKFIQGVIEQKRRILGKYGERYFWGFNCNAPIETERLLLRPCDEEFDQKYFAYLKNSPSVFEEYYRMPFDDGCGPNLRQAHKPLSFGIIEKNSGSLIGLVALNHLRSGVVYNLEYLVFPDYRQKGFATEAVSGLLDAAQNHQLLLSESTIREGVYGSKTADIKCIEAIVRTGNLPSASLLKKVGFKFNGIQPYYAPLFHGEYSDAEIYDLLLPAS